MEQSLFSPSLMNVRSNNGRMAKRLSAHSVSLNLTFLSTRRIDFWNNICEAEARFNIEGAVLPQNQSPPSALMLSHGQFPAIR
jgi:hypothetical protein